ncbi:hypothetical protein M422DRAFT_242395 [Sphaerobolus stellatus SS14]|nr:hypothetical protein M422DRAFT_242395 [Sphaerobolus stellatus SS14]
MPQTRPTFSLRFPSFKTLPAERAKGIPRGHWCLLVEVVEDISLLNPVYEVEDKDGLQTYIRFRVNPAHVYKFVSPSIKDRYTPCIMYAVRSRFLDGTIGIAMKEPGFVKYNRFFPINYELS